ncbi:MAG: outer membrane protein [Candidatus Cyclobacteriaceae bacterium M2_1C_046]
MLKKLVFGIITVASITVLSNSAQAQFSPGPGFKQFNFGLQGSSGLGAYVGFDFGVSDFITIGPRLSFEYHTTLGAFGIYDYSTTLILPSFRGDYHFSGHIDALPDELDLYGGISAGVGLFSYNHEDPSIPDNSEANVEAWVQAGARWYFNDNWGANVEFTGGSFSSISGGLSFKF